MANLRTSAERTVARAMSEAQLQDSVMALARYRGWLAYHTHNSRHSAAGFPDCAMVRGEVLLFAELKREGENPTKEQRAWLNRIKRVSEAVGWLHVQWYVWRPSDWLSGEIERALQ